MWYDQIFFLNDLLAIKKDIKINRERSPMNLFSPVSFLLGFDSANRVRLFAEDDALTDYVASFRTVAPAAIFVGDGQQFNNQHMNQTLVLAAFE